MLAKRQGSIQHYCAANKQTVDNMEKLIGKETLKQWS